jgi:hypothetical protein
MAAWEVLPLGVEHFVERAIIYVKGGPFLQ